MRWLSRMLFVSLILFSFIFFYKYVNNEYAASDEAYSYPMNINLYEIYENLTRKPELGGYLRVSPINPANFPLLLSPENLCEPVYDTPSNSGAQAFLDIMFLVKSRPTSLDKRSAIRETWGNPNCTLKFGMHTRVIFLLGMLTDTEPTLESLIHTEHANHDDILRFGFVDSYRNNTYKVMTALQHVAKICPAARYVVLVDDDFLVHVENLIKIIQQVTKLQYQTYVAGMVFNRPKPIRKPWNKWYVSYRTYPYDFYVPFASGGTIILTMPVVQLLAAGMPFVRYFWIDDVFLGIVLHKYGIAPKHLPGIYLTRTCTDFQLPSLISCHGYNDPLLMHEAWSKLTKRCKNQSH